METPLFPLMAVVALCLILVLLAIWLHLQAKEREARAREMAEFSKQVREELRLLRQDHLGQLERVYAVLQQELDKMRSLLGKELDVLRQTVDEKLQQTLNRRLAQSFETVGQQLQAVQQGLGEMRALASDVGGLKRVLSNVKLRGNLGEVQLAMLLDQILAPDQYEANVHTKKGSRDVVEFAVKLPGKEPGGSPVYLPIDAKFPKEVYAQLQDAYDTARPEAVATARKQLELTIKHMAKDIGTKYLDPPATTHFGLLFLPFEGIYAEVVRNAALLEDLQRTYKVIVTGPTTLAALLNSLQLGFRTLAIEKRSTEVWRVLGAVKTEFGKFSDLLGKAQRNIQTGLHQMDDVLGRRSRAIAYKLREVEGLSPSEARDLLPGTEEGEFPLCGGDVQE